MGRYPEAPYLAIDNNATERAPRPIAVGRNNWLHLGSDAGGRTAAVLLSVVQTCHAPGVESWAYLRDVLERVSTHPASRLAELLPDAWKPAQTAEATGRKAEMTVAPDQGHAGVGKSEARPRQSGKGPLASCH